ncbi:trigger factor [Synechococcus sp. JA-2-3B'a(2-13)]|uniref:Trigger factor n=1 Tax=Synechococcus sp. (strain JA-2-3B'a(2-13)) TaxID=321332 RepID=TIG_SYNJB|nr:trigger factor [Synechococcus sp. JA-2-3B'a(2-13)]Q2JQ33.1 RecName: Full=Trigger factor; Short=TF; AltName: Full=PPIase [Synechococcus sp. JA-2-3B'a(2-13)]ABD01083.1 trigger factor [Synechococcus sp. JA-2-3B'a(2-13)]
MQVTQEKRPGSRVGLKIVVEADRVKRSYEKTLRQLEQNIQIPGFRKGKAPRNLVVRQVGRERILASAVDDLINEAIQQAFKEAQLTPISRFELDDEVGQLLAQFNPEADFSFSGYVEVYPEARVGQYKGLTVTATRVDVKPEQIDQLIDRWRDQRATLLPVEDRPAQLGDVVVIDFAARDAEGNPLDEMTTQDFQLELKEDNFIPGFVAGIVGMQLDETKEIAATFPDDYFRKELAGKTVTFIVCLREIKAKELPELDDAFVQEISSFQTVAELREHLQKRLEQDALRQSEENLETAILNAILETTEVDLPETLIEQETTQLLAQSLQALRQEGIKPGELRKFLSELPPETLNQLKERHRPEAIDRLRRTLALSAIVRQEQIAVGSTELDVEVEEVMAAYAQQGQKLDRERVRQAVYESLLTNKVMAWLKSQTTVNWVDSEGNPTQAPTSLAGSEEKVEVPEAEFEADEPEAEVSGIPEAVESSSETATGAETDGEAAAAEAEPATEKAVEASPAETVSASAAEATLPVEEKAAETATEIPAAEKPKPSKKDKKGK